MKKIFNKNLRHIVIGTDANYLHKALVFYNSLSKVHSNFLLHIFCFDDTAYNVLRRLGHENIKLYQASEFENKEILKIKSQKEKRYEYYWAINAFITLKVMNEESTDFVTLADCDIMFFQSPEVIFDEFDGSDVIIQPNNFSFEHEKDFIPVGYYCSSFQSFRKNPNGKKILKYWHDQCMKWCLANFEEGKFGDQKYLDDWRIRFKRVREVANIGTNVAPWNIQKFDLSLKNNRVVINNKWDLVYYHYHSFRMNLSDYAYIITGDRNNTYRIPEDAIKHIYTPYIKELKEAIKTLKKNKEYVTYVSSNPKGLQKDFSGQTIRMYSHT